MRGFVALLMVLCLASVARATDDAERLRRVVAHTLAMQRPDGLFQYDFDFLTGESSGEDHIVRQAGVLFALGGYRLASGDVRIDAVLRTVLDRLAERSLPVGRSTAQSALEALGLFALPSLRWGAWLRRAGLLYSEQGDGRLVAGEEGYAKAFPGATAFALIGELAYHRATGDDRFAATREAWLRGLEAVHVSGRGMRYSPERLESDAYADGETWYALAQLHRDFPDEMLAAALLEDLEATLLERYASHADPKFYHWGALAAAERYAATHDARFARFAGRQSEAFLEAMPSEKTRLETTCAVIEGVASALWVLEAEDHAPAVTAALRRRLAVELERNRAMQIEPGQERLALGAGATLLAPTLARHAGAFLAGPYRPYWRLDIDLHCISALLAVQRLRAGEGNGD